MEDPSIAYGAKFEKIISGFTYTEDVPEETAETSALDDLLDEDED